MDVTNGDCTDVNVCSCYNVWKAMIATLASLVRQRAMMIKTVCMDNAMQVNTVSAKLDGMATSVIS